MDPVTNGGYVVADRTLGDLAFVVGKEEVHTTTMNIELCTQVLGAHGRALDMPARESFTPGALPPHDMFRWRCLPEGKVCLVFFLFLSFEVTGSFEEVIDHPAA